MVSISFIISFVLLPAVLSFLPTPPKSTLKYLENRWIVSFLNKVENWVFTHKQTVLLTVSIVLIFSIAGIFRLKSVGYIVDDLPKTDKIYTDLKFFEQKFRINLTHKTGKMIFKSFLTNIPGKIPVISFT
jgi:hypothetical protein